jgi:predicted transcriptional regulator
VRAGFLHVGGSITEQLMPNKSGQTDKEEKVARQSLYEYKRDGILSAVATLTEAQGKAPSLREIASVADVSVATLHSYLLKMKEEGVVQWTEKHHRSLRVQTPGSTLVGSGRTP